MHDQTIELIETYGERYGEDRDSFAESVEFARLRERICVQPEDRQAARDHLAALERAEPELWELCQ